MHNASLRRASCALLSLALAASLTVPALATTGTQSIQADYTDIKVSLDGQYLVLTDVNGTTVEPFAVAGTTYLPVRAVAGALGLNVEWQAETSTVVLTSGGEVTTQTTDTPAAGTTGAKTIQADYADIKVTLDGTQIALVDANGAAVEPFAVAGTTYLPVRAVSTALGLEVDWNAESNTVVLTSAAEAEEPTETEEPADTTDDGFTITAEEAKALVQGNLDELYLGKYDQSYLDLVSITAEEAEAGHLNNILAEAEYFCLYWGIVMPENDESFDTLDTTVKNEVIDLITEIYTHSKYTVADAVAQEDGSYTVDVTVSPIDVVARASEAYDSGTYEPLNTFNAKYTSEVVAELTQSEYEAYSIEYANVILDLVQAQMGDAGYEADQVITMTISKDADGAFSGDEDTWYDIDALIISYPAE